MIILMTGATGLIGKPLASQLSAEGHRLRVLSRDSRSTSERLGVDCEAYEWNAGQGIPEQALEGVGAVIHLAGEPVADRRWSASQKEEILRSRREGTQALVRSVATYHQRTGRAPEVFLSASATGFYGDRGDEVLTEDSPPGADFLSQVCQAWEGPLAELPSPVRAVMIRIGIVIAPGGGALQKMLPVFSTGLGGPLGNGRQWMSWIQLEDLVSAICFALSTSALQGPVNAVSPAPIRNAEFATALGHALGRPARLRAPAFALKLALGEVTDVLLASQRVEPGALIRAGFRFSYPELATALARSVPQRRRSP